MSTKNKSQKTPVGCTWSAGNENQKKQDYKLSQSCYEQKVSDDGTKYVEVSYGENGKRTRVLFEVGKNGVEAMHFDVLKEEDARAISNEINASRLTSWDYERAESAEMGEGYIERHAVQKQMTVHELAFPEERVLSKEEKLVQEVLKTCTEKQLFVYELRCCRTYPMSYPEIAELFTEYFGTPTSEDGTRNLYLKVCDKVCRALGVQRPNKNKHRD